MGHLSLSGPIYYALLAGEETWARNPCGHEGHDLLFLPIKGRYSIVPEVLFESKRELTAGRSELNFALLTSSSSATRSSETTMNLAPSISVR